MKPFLAALVALLVLACSSSSASSTVGTWTTDAGATTLVLQDDGAFVMDTRKKQHITGKWSLVGSDLTLTSDGAGGMSGSFSGKVEGGQLKLQFGPKESVYERKK